MSAVDTLIKQHGGKTVTVSLGTIFLFAWIGADAGLYEVPVPATRAYVDAKVTQAAGDLERKITEATRGLPYLVKQAVERDVDVTAYEVQCNNRVEQQGSLDRLMTEYKTLTGTDYVRKSCDALARALRSQQ